MVIANGYNDAGCKQACVSGFAGSWGVLPLSQGMEPVSSALQQVLPSGTEPWGCVKANPMGRLLLQRPLAW